MNKFVSIAAAAGLLFGFATMAAAKSAKPANTPGHMMQRYGSVPGHPGASGYAPGHLKQGKMAKRPMLRTRSTTGSR